MEEDKAEVLKIIELKDDAETDLTYLRDAVQELINTCNWNVTMEGLRFQGFSTRSGEAIQKLQSLLHAQQSDTP